MTGAWVYRHAEAPSPDGAFANCRKMPLAFCGGFSYNWEKNNDILKDRTDFDQFSIAINQTSLNKDINSILEKYSLRVDTITSGIEPKALGIPLEEFAKSRGIKKMNQNMPKIITDAPIRVTCKSVRM